MKVYAEAIEEKSGQTDCQYFVSPIEIVNNTGTWTMSISSGIPVKSRSAAAAATGFAIPINPPGVRSSSSRGCKVTKVDIYYSVGTQDLSDFPAANVKVVKITADYGTNAATAAVGGTLTLSLTTTQRCETTSGQKKLSVTLGTPAFVGNNEMWWLICDPVTAQANTVLTLQGAVVHYTRAL